MEAFPNKESRRLIEDYGAKIAEPQQRLEFVLRSGKAVRDNPAGGRMHPLGPWGRRLSALDAMCKASLLPTETLEISLGDRVSLAGLQLLRVPIVHWKFALASVGVLVIFTQARNIRFSEIGAQPQPVHAAHADEPSRGENNRVESGKDKGGAAIENRQGSVGGPAAFDGSESRKLDVWLVKTDAESELYSNGLRISNRRLTHTGPRNYGVYSRGPGNETTEIDRRSRPVGLVYHTTESDLPTFERTNNQAIRYEGRKLLGYISREQLYHFVIDRFGQVHRIVPESEYAFHAGYSLWADGGELYINLNQSFIGISFESRPKAAGPDTPPEEGVTEAQFAGARLLTEMLREKFSILETNCVTHEMVSVNPNKMLIGYHTDWRGRFPFAKVGLSDNYQAVLVGPAEWGFGYDSDFVSDLGGDVWPGIRRSEALFRREAKRRKLSLRQYRRQQGRRFLALVRNVKKTTPTRTWADHVSAAAPETDLGSVHSTGAL